MVIKIGTKNGKEVYFERHRSLNGHLLLIGKSGSGKSVAAESLCLEIVKNGGTIIAFDLHQVLAPDQIFGDLKEGFDEYSNIIDVYKQGITCPLFTPLVFEDGETEKEIDTVGAVTDVITRAYGLHCQQKATLRKAVMHTYNIGAYASEGIIALDDALVCIGSEVAVNVREKLFQVTNHNVFKDGPLFIKPGMINIIRLSQFDLETQSVLGEIILSYIWRLASARSLEFNPLYIYADEAQNLTLRKTGALAQFLSEGRKFGINLLLATQSLSVGFSTTEQKRLMQTGLQLYFRPANNEVNQVAKMLDPAKVADWALALRTLRVGECIATGALRVEDKEIDVPLKISFRKE